MLLLYAKTARQDIAFPLTNSISPYSARRDGVVKLEILHVQVKAIFLFSNLVLKSDPNRLMSGKQLLHFRNGLSDWLAHITAVSDV